ncbi:MAG: FAD-dependent monooxygenase [Alphaproteobacteria bacterium]|nr:FAD-dependent monooxygenase [Alphaproteobacteria bacterium]
MTKPTDIIVSGASYTGTALALALNKALNGELNITLLDRAPAGSQPPPSPRSFAISAASRNLLDYIGVWQSIAAETQPVSEIEITDSPLEAGIRPVLLTYENTIDTGEPASHIVPDGLLANALKSTLANTTGLEVVHGCQVESFADSENSALLTCSDGRSFEGDLIVAAEGRISATRESAGIKSIGWDYGQSGICTVVAHSKPHEGRAVQHFLPAGPFAILPLPGNRSCITWTEKTGEAKRIIGLGDNEFMEEVDKRFSGRLGELTLEARPASWPLSLRLARSLIAPRLALIGDTARGVHPIAGQGLNLGFRDVAALCEVIVDNARIGMAPSNPDGLARYERWRRFDSTVSSMAFDKLNTLFSNDSTLLRSMREAGLGLIDRIPTAKSFLVREAAGLTGEVPRLLRGEAI